MFHHIEDEEPQPVESTSSPPTKRLRGKALKWERLQKFDDASAFKPWFDNKEVTESLVKGNLSKGQFAEKRVYNCSFRKKFGCPFMLRVDAYRGESTIDVLWNGENHNHNNRNAENTDRDVPRITADARLAIQQWLKQGFTASQIHRKLRDDGFPVPLRSQLNNCIAYIRGKESGGAGFTSADLLKWVEENSDASTLESAIVAGHFVQPNEGGETKFGVVLSTPKLLQLVINEPFAQGGCLHTDATYKLICQGFPVLILAISDANRRTHPVALSVTSHEDTECFEFLMQTLQQSARKLTGVTYKPRVVVGDGAKAITNAVQNVYGEGCLRAMCWAHVYRSIQRRLVGLPSAVRESVLAGLETLQLAPSEGEFNMCLPLFLDWLRRQPELQQFAEYFTSQWLGELKGWFEGFTPARYPSTNNGLEAVNGTLKSSYTLRDRLPLPRFLDLAKTVVEEWTVTERQEGFSNTRGIQLSEWTKAWQWTQGAVISNAVVLGQQLVFVKASDGKETPEEFPRLVEEFVAAITEGFSTWETYCRFRTALWTVFVMDSAEGYLCNCPTMLKKGLCSHSLGLRIMFKGLQVPPQAKTIPLGQRRKRGRPAKATRALDRQ